MDGLTVVSSVNYEVKAWRKWVTFTYEGKEYSVALLWDEYDGYEITKGWDELPDELKDNGGEFCDMLDELTYLINEKTNA